MAVISKDLIIEAFNKASKFVKNNRILVRFTSFALVAVIALVVSVVSCGITLGFNVVYGGKTIAVVSDSDIFKNARETVIENLNLENGKKIIGKAEFDMTLTTKNSFINEADLADTIIQNTDGLSLASALVVNGDVVAYAERCDLENVVNTALCKYYVKDAENTSTFVDEIEIQDVYCLEDSIRNLDELKSVGCELKVKTVSRVIEESAVKYSTKTVYTSSKNRGYESVTTKGENGVKSETTVLETVNGKETAKTVIERKVIKQPVQKVVLKGTATPMASATSKAEAQSAGFIRPMNRGDVKLVTAYWGDGRGHRGIDLAGDTGSPIFAAKAGKVVSAGWDGNYGYSVLIDHGNGYQTRYAHNSALCVKKGATVSQGQQIAKLGNTGRSTGPHLHFEILKNGSQINPAAYIGY